MIETSAQRLVLGIDTGGTYTDAVLMAPGQARPLAFAKALTTPVDLSIGITEAIDGLDRRFLPNVRRVCLSTLRGQLVIPPYAQVANAIGAAVGKVKRTVEIDVRPVDQSAALSHYVVHSSAEMSEWPSLEKAIARAEEIGRRVATEELYGTLGSNDGVMVETSRIVREASARGADARVLMGVVVRTTAWVDDRSAE